MTDENLRQRMYKIGYNEALEEVEKMISKLSIIECSDYDGKHNLIDLNDLDKQLTKLKEKK
jgi:hypothetical protein